MEEKSADKNQPIKRRHSKRRTFLFVSIGVFLLAAATCVALYFFWPYLGGKKVDPGELPQIKIETLHANLCPNGKVLNLKFKVTDEKDGDITNSAKVISATGGAIIKAIDSDVNEAATFVPAEIGDKVAPAINLNGEPSYTVLVGNTLEVPAATATDNCDGELEVQTSGSYDVNVVGNYSIIYTATDNSGNTATAQRNINVTSNSGIIYLTFDDGPGPYTNALLDVLKKYNVKATFFVTNAGDDAVLKREYDEGHAIGLHSATHDYGYIYQNVDNYFADLNAVQQRVQNVTGQTSNLIRFPGGSSNTISRNYDGGARIMSQLTALVKERGFTYFDWNVSSGDAAGAYTAGAVYNNVVGRLAPNQNWVVLQHDIKGFSVDAVESIIQYGLAQGFTFKKLDATSFTAAHGVNN